MKQTMPQEAMTIPSEADAQASTDAARAGMTVGEWLTKSVSTERTDTLQAPDDNRAPADDNAAIDDTDGENIGDENTRDDNIGDETSGDENNRDAQPVTILAQSAPSTLPITHDLARTELNSEPRARSIDDTLRALGQHLLTAETTRDEVNQAISATTAELDASKQQHALALGEIARRMSQVERGMLDRESGSGELHESVRHLHQRVSRLADRLAGTTTDSSDKIEKLASTLGLLCEKIESSQTEQAQTLDQVTQRVDQIEREPVSKAMREAVRALHLGLSQLSENVGETATKSTIRINTLAGNVENLSESIAATRDHTGRFEKELGARLYDLGEGLRRTEHNLSPLAERVDTLVGNLDALAESVASTRDQTARTAQDVKERLLSLATSQKQAEDALAPLAARIDDATAETHNRIGAISGNLDALSEAFASARDEAGRANEVLAGRLTLFDDRLTRAEDGMAPLAEQIADGVADSSNRFDTLKDELDSLSNTLATTTSQQARELERIAKRSDDIARDTDPEGLRADIRELREGLSQITVKVAHTTSESSERVHSFADNIDELAQKIASAGDASDQTNRNWEENFTRLTERLARTEDGVSPLIERIAGAETELSNRIYRLVENFANLSETVRSLDFGASGSDPELVGRVDSLDHGLRRTEEKLNSTEASLREVIGHHLSPIECNLKNIQARLEQTEQSREVLEGSMTELVRSLTERLEAAELYSQETTEDRAAPLIERIDRTETEESNRIYRLVENLANLSETVRLLDDRTSGTDYELIERANSLDNGLKRTEEALRSTESSLREVLSRHLSPIEGNLKNIQARLEQSEHGREDLEGSIMEGVRSLASRLEAVESHSRETLSEFRCGLSEMDRRIDGLSRGAPHIDLLERSNPMIAAVPEAPPFLDAPVGFLPLDKSDAEPRRDTPTPARDSESNNGDFASSEEQGLEGEAHYTLPMARGATQAAFEAEPADGQVCFPEPAPTVTQNRDEGGRLLDRIVEVGRGRGELIRRATGSTSMRAAAAVFLAVAGIGGYLLSSGGSPFSDDIIADDRRAAPVSVVTIGTERTGATPSATNTFAVEGAPNEPERSLPGPNDGTVVVATGGTTPDAGSPATMLASQGLAASGPTLSPPQTAEPDAASPLDRLISQAKAGSPQAALVLGLKYLRGEGVATSESEAVRWLHQASEQGEAVAQYRLGALYERGQGVPADQGQALHWYEQAARNGNSRAMHNLAVSYAEAPGAEKNLDEAARWAMRAAEYGLADSQFNLAVLYERGMGLPASLDAAYRWYLIAAGQGDAEAQTRADVLATLLPEDQRIAAERAAAAFVPTPANKAANEAPTLAEIAP